MAKIGKLLLAAVLVSGLFWAASCGPGHGCPGSGCKAKIRASGKCEKGKPCGGRCKARAKLCTKCGQVKGSDACCKPGAEVCTKCGLAKGSPGCCKIKKSE